MRLLTSLLLFLGIGSGLSALAGTIDPHTPDSKYVEFGKEFPSVVRIKCKIKCTKPDCPKKEHDYLGSAVVIRPNWIITAGHVVAGTHAQRIVRDDGTEHEIRHLIVHEAFDEDKIGLHDLALGYSPKDFNLKFYTPLYTEADELGKPITIAGYGVPGTFTSGAQHDKADDKKRGGHNVVESAFASVLICTPSAGLKRMPLEFMITPGDSGGGMFIGDRLAGINSFLLATDKSPDGTYGDESAFTRVSLYADWIERQIEEYERALQARSTTGPVISVLVPEK